ncbi:MAG: DUF4832 domain-containing protein [Planctomycetota bacterium]
MQKALGYRLVVEAFRCSKRADPKCALRVAFSVANQDAAPFYEKWPVEFSFVDAATGDLVRKTTLDESGEQSWN